MPALIKKSLSGLSKSPIHAFNLCLKWRKKISRLGLPVLDLLNKHHIRASFSSTTCRFQCLLQDTRNKNHQNSRCSFPTCPFSQRSPWGIAGESFPTWDLLVLLTPVSLRLTPVTPQITLRCLRVWICLHCHALICSYNGTGRASFF